MTRSKRARGPRALAATVSTVTRALFRGRGFGAAFVDWPDIVGRPLADHSRPERLSRNGTLRVRVSGSWAVELQHLEPVVLDRIATYFGYRAVTRLALVQGPLPAPPARRARRVRALDKVEEADLRARLTDTDDADLRVALESLGRAGIGTAAGAAGETPTAHAGPEANGA